MNGDVWMCGCIEVWIWRCDDVIVVLESCYEFLRLEFGERVFLHSAFS